MSLTYTPHFNTAFKCDAIVTIINSDPILGEIGLGVYLPNPPCLRKGYTSFRIYLQHIAPPT